MTGVQTCALPILVCSSDLVRSVNIENMIEILKAKKYNEILNFIGKHEILKVEDFYNKFSVEKNYQILKKLEQRQDKKEKLENDKVNIEIKRTEGYFVNELGAKEYIFNILRADLI